jgi:hypothetical protein
MATRDQGGRVEVRRTVQLDDALGQPVGVFLLLPGVLEELGLGRAVAGAADGVVVTLVAQCADQLGGQRVVQHGDHRFAVGLVAYGDGAVVEVGGGGADGGNVEAVGQRCFIFFHDDFLVQ